MKQKVFSFLFFGLVISLFCMACWESTSDKQPSLPITDLPLSEQNIYNYSKIKRARETANDAHKVVAKKKLEGGASLINMGEQQAGTDTLMRSILHYPTSKAYFQLGNIHLESAQHEEAINAYKIITSEQQPETATLKRTVCSTTHVLKTFVIPMNLIKYI